MWDPQQYGVYADERARPFTDLVARVRVGHPRLVVDLGCGPATLTAALLDRWPHAQVVGVDSSAEMLAAAPSRPGLHLVHADIRTWQPPDRVDVVLCSAALQWVSDHRALLPRFASWLAPGGTLAIHLPGNAGDPAHVSLAQLRTSSRWRDRLAAAGGQGPVGEPFDYLVDLVRAGLVPDVWETTYLHVLPGEDAVVAWMRGSALRPLLAVLDAGEQQELVAEYGERLRAAYPRRAFGTVLPFRRIFAVGHASA